MSIILGSFILVSLLVFCLVPIRTVSYQVTVQRQVTEPYYETEPYTVQEPYTYQEPYTVREKYTVQEPYQISRYIDYQVVDTWTNEVIEGLGVVTYTYVTIRNLDNQDGTFSVSFTFRSRTRGRNFYDSDRIYIQSEREATAEGRFDNWLGEDWSWTYDISPEKITETKYRTITKYRDTIKYQPVIKYRDVTKYRQVKKERLVWKPFTEIRYKNVSMLEYLTH